jgi:hypothetical protein
MDQEQMRAYWRSAPAGRLCPWEQAKALALREVGQNEGKPPTLDWIAARLTKVGGGHPEKSALSEFFLKVDADQDWFPGKHNGTKRGPVPLLTAAKRRCVANSAMAAKRAGEEPCVAAVIQSCPVSTMNPVTKRPFTPPTIRKIFLEDLSESVSQKRKTHNKPTNNQTNKTNPYFPGGLLRFRPRAPVEVPARPAEGVPLTRC